MWRPVAGVSERTFPIGKLVDSSDDLARLMIVTQYAGTKTVNVYTPDPMDTELGTKAGFISSNDAAELTTNDLALRPEGTYYPAGAGMLMVMVGLDDALALPEGSLVADGADGKPGSVLLLSDPDMTVKKYVVATINRDRE